MKNWFIIPKDFLRYAVGVFISMSLGFSIIFLSPNYQWNCMDLISFVVFFFMAIGISYTIVRYSKYKNDKK